MRGFWSWGLIVGAHESDIPRCGASAGGGRSGGLGVGVGRGDGGVVIANDATVKAGEGVVFTATRKTV